MILPGIDDLDIFRSVRNKDQKKLIVLLRDRTGLQNRLAGFAAGLDDHLPKSFYVEALIAQLKKLGKKSPGQAHSVIEEGHFQALSPVDRETHSPSRKSMRGELFIAPSWLRI